MGSDERSPAAPASARRLVWRRFRRDRFAAACGIGLITIVLACFVGGPLLARALGHGPNDPFPYAVDVGLKPAGLWTRVPSTSNVQVPEDVADVSQVEPGGPTTLLILGADGTLGRDLLLRLLYGGQVSLEVAFAATVLAILVGALLGLLAGLAGGIVDAAIARLTELVMAFPVLFFLVLLGSSSFGSRLQDVTLGVFEEGVLSVALVIATFTWFYPARLVRSIVLSLRPREFVEAAVAAGGSTAHIARHHLVPHLLTPLLVYGTVAVATNMLLEIGITFLNAGVRLPTASWGRILSDTWGSPTSPGTWTPSGSTIWPTICTSILIFLTAACLHQLAEGLRSALGSEPRR